MHTERRSPGVLKWRITCRRPVIVVVIPLDTMPGTYTNEDQINDLSHGRPHLVILGAGASLAACPDGDASGIRLPLMNDLIETVSLGAELDSAGIQWKNRNFEDVYAELCDEGTLADTASQLNNAIAEYFGSMQLPDEPNIYDYLVLGLRPKDVIATFNWDPFLWQALARNRSVASPPHFLFLHGCSVVGHCVADRQQGYVGRPCPKCNQSLAPTKLLYPVTDKDYVTDPYISTQWNLLKEVLEKVYLVTVFGYAAPPTDAAAIDLMQTSWGPSESREFEDIEIIDIKPEDELADTWDAFIHSSHYSITSSFFKSLVFDHPRRTCEAMWAQFMDAKIIDANSPPREPANLQELQQWYSELVDVEVSAV